MVRARKVTKQFDSVVSFSSLSAQKALVLIGCAAWLHKLSKLYIPINKLLKKRFFNHIWTSVSYFTYSLGNLVTKSVEM